MPMGKKIPFHCVGKQEMGPEAALQGVALVKEGGSTGHQPNVRIPLLPLKLQEAS